MNQSSAKSGRRDERRRSRHHPDSRAVSAPTTQLTIVIALLAAAFLWPSLGAIDGDGLHLSFLWMLALTGILLWKSVYGEPDSMAAASDRLAMWGFGLFFAGTWLSTAYVFSVGGDRRAALNLAFEWTGIAACGWLCRTLARDERCRRALINLIAGLGIGLAVFGIWQSHVFYARQADEYLAQRELLDNPNRNPTEAARIRQEFAREDIPLDGAARQLLEHRLLSSSEPFGPFALANTLAGVLAVALVLLVGQLQSDVVADRRTFIRLLPDLLAVSVVAWCLVLTKSRTAWVGAAVGLAVVLIFTNRRSAHDANQQSWVRKVAGIALMIGVPAVLLAIGGVLVGAIDREVLLESPRSLQFRLFYWIGAAGVIRESPIFGAGPGNFRQAYLPHKLAESSEAILDPHNIVIDAWCFAGVTGLIGLLLIIAAVVRGVWTASNAEAASSAASGQSGSAKVTSKQIARRAHGAGAGLLLCLLIHFAWLWITGIVLSTAHAMTIVLIACAGTWTWMQRQKVRGIPPVATSAAALALIVHLLGAGGLQISVMGFLLVTLVTLINPPGAIERGRRPATRRRWPLPVAAGICGLVATCVLFQGLFPVVTSDYSVRLGLLRQSSGNTQGALSAFEQAAAADPLAPAPHEHIARALAFRLTRRLQQNPDDGSADDLIRDALDACNAWLTKDNHQIGPLIARSNIYFLLYQHGGTQDAIEASVRDLAEVVRRHPGDAHFRTRLAIRQQEAGDLNSAHDSADAALKIESINRAWGHSDQYLSADELETIDRILEKSSQ